MTTNGEQKDRKTIAELYMDSARENVERAIDCMAKIAIER